MFTKIMTWERGARLPIKLSIYFIIILIVMPTGGKLHSGKRPPVIFVPGNGGSQIDAKLNKSSAVHYICEKKSDYFNLWLNMELLVPVIIDCWVDNIKLLYDNVTRTTSNNEGVEVRIPGFGDPSYVEWIDPSKASIGNYFKDIANALLALGYHQNVSIRGAPYDFRKAPNENKEYFIKLKSLIEDTYRENGNTPVVLIAHSMGGPMCLHFLHQQAQKWKDTYIRALISLSGAWGGSTKAIKAYAVGDNLGSRFLSESTMREVQITFPSIAFLLPSSLFWKPNEVLVETSERNYTWNDIKDFLEDVDVPDAWEIWQDVQNYTLDFRPPGVEVHCLHGFNVSTVERLVYKKGEFPQKYPSFTYGDGDGTVNSRSLEGCMLWKSIQKKPVYHQTFPQVDHMGILTDSRVLEYITSLFALKL